MGKSNKLYPIGFPKLDHVMQTAIYLHMRKPLEEHYSVKIPYFLIRLSISRLRKENSISE